MLKIRNIKVGLILISIIASTFVALNQVADTKAITINDLKATKLTGRELLNKFEYEIKESDLVADDPIFKNVADGDIIDY
ncbi:MAG: hypothetical protein ACTSQ0_07485, partial [Candidatus Heimdallarchaeota archaeon]